MRNCEECRNFEGQATFTHEGLTDWQCKKFGAIAGHPFLRARYCAWFDELNKAKIESINTNKEKPMKIIEGMKKVKELTKKAADLRQKIAMYSADMTTDTPTYKTEADQKAMVSGWLQAHFDISKEIERLRIAITYTNVTHKVSIILEDGKQVEKSIQAWIMRRRELATFDCEAWKALSIRTLKNQAYKPDARSEEIKIAEVRRYYDQEQRDKMVSLFTSEPHSIDATLEVVNAITDLKFPE